VDEIPVILQPTLVSAPNFDADRDCEALNYAFKGLGTREDIIVRIIGNRSNQQRLEIKSMYKTMFGKVKSFAFFSIF
jgi:hypothetical protein